MGKIPSFSKKSDRDIESGAKSRAIEDWGSAQQVGFATVIKSDDNSVLMGGREGFCHAHTPPAHVPEPVHLALKIRCRYDVAQICGLRLAWWTAWETQFVVHEIHSARDRLRLSARRHRFTRP